MGHIGNSEHDYRFLQERLSQKVQANPASDTLIKILQILFSPDDAKLAGQLPHNLTPVEQLAKNLNIPLEELNDRLTAMARRGVVFDIESKGRRYVTLPPVVIGFFEFVFMRARPDLPMKELAHLFEKYFTENDGALVKTFWQGETQFARTFVMEETLQSHDHAEILDWERASRIVSTAKTISVGLCQCQHMARHQGKGCDKPQEVCLTFGYAAESLIRNGQTRMISQEEALQILEQCKEKNLIQIGDNVQHQVSFICNCCKCCCHMLKGIRNYSLYKGVVSSNWIMEVNVAKCNGCGECVKACPVEALGIEETRHGNRRKRWAVLKAEACLGCGLCSILCKSGGAVMNPRPQRVIAPETIFDQRVAMAIERGKLADLLFDDPGRLSHRALGRLMGSLERASLFKKAMASESIKSSFINLLVKGAKREAGELADRL